MEGNREAPMDGEVRVKGAEVQLGGVYSSHTLHGTSPANTGSSSISASSRSRRERLIAAAIEVLAEGSVDRLVESRDTPKAL